MVELNEEKIVVKKVEGGSIINHPPLFSENGRLVKKIYNKQYLLMIYLLTYIKIKLVIISGWYLTT